MAFPPTGMADEAISLIFEIATSLVISYNSIILHALPCTGAKLQNVWESAKKVGEKFGGNGKNAYSAFASRAFN